MRDALNSLRASGSLDLQGLSEHSSSKRMETDPFLRMFRPLVILLEEDCGEVSVSDSVSLRASSGAETAAALVHFLFNMKNNHNNFNNHKKIQ
jgi:hypothetical protein